MTCWLKPCKKCIPTSALLITSSVLPQIMVVTSSKLSGTFVHMYAYYCVSAVRLLVICMKLTKSLNVNFSLLLNFDYIKPITVITFISRSYTRESKCSEVGNILNKNLQLSGNNNIALP